LSVVKLEQSEDIDGRKPASFPKRFTRIYIPLGEASGRGSVENFG
jgi:hypothetical protein